MRPTPFPNQAQTLVSDYARFGRQYELSPELLSRCRASHTAIPPQTSDAKFAGLVDRNGTKEQLIVRLLDRQCPDDGTLHRTPSHTPRAMADEGLKYNRMELHELRNLCRV